MQLILSQPIPPEEVTSLAKIESSIDSITFDNFLFLFVGLDLNHFYLTKSQAF